MAVVAERLRRLTRNQIPLGSVGSNPTDCDFPVFLCQAIFSIISNNVNAYNQLIYVDNWNKIK